MPQVEPSDAMEEMEDRKRLEIADSAARIIYDSWEEWSEIAGGAATVEQSSEVFDDVMLSKIRQQVLYAMEEFR